MDIIRVKRVITRKEHQCSACLRNFPKGTCMECGTCADSDNGIYNLYTCLDCEELIRKCREEIIDPWDNSYAEGCIRNYLKRERLRIGAMATDLAVKYIMERYTGGY